MIEQLALPFGCQRWHRRVDTYQHPEGRIDPSRYGVEPVTEAQAKAFVERHHYSRTYPAARARVGLFRTRVSGGVDLVGVAVFSVPMHQRVVPKWTGQDPACGVELGRLVLLDDVEGNGETWFIARAFRQVVSELPDVRAVVSFSDPVPRVNDEGVVVKPGHYGTIYQASNARFVGRASPATLVLAPDGSVVSNRAISKLRNGERGAAGVYDRLVALGAPTRRLGEDDRVYVDRALDGWRRVRHPGNLAYVFALGGRTARRTTEAGFPPAMPYPKVTS